MGCREDETGVFGFCGVWVLAGRIYVRGIEYYGRYEGDIEGWRVWRFRFLLVVFV